MDYSESFLANEWNVTRTGGTTATAFRHHLDRGVPQAAAVAHRPADQRPTPTLTAIAAAMLAKYKDPLTRVVSLSVLTSDPDVSDAVFALDIGSRIRVFRTPPGGGSRIDQTLFVQSIEVSTYQWPIFKVTLGVSPQ